MYRLGLLLILLCLMKGAFAASDSQSLDSIAAIANDSIITQSELQDASRKIKQQLQASNISVPPPAVLYKQVLDQLINRTLQLAMAAQMGIGASNADVDKAIQGIAKNNHLTLSQLYAVVSKQGLTKAEYRKELRDELIIHRLQDQTVGPKVTVTPQDVDDFMHSPAWLAQQSREYHVEDILIALPDTPSSQQVAAARSEAEATLAKLKQGASFHQLAQLESGGSKALQGGDLGWRKLPEVPTAFADYLVGAKANDIFGPIQTANGFHLIHIAGIRNVAAPKTRISERKQIQQLLFERKYEEAVQAFVAKLRAEAYVNLNPSAGYA